MSITPVTLSIDDFSDIGQVRPSGLTKTEKSSSFDNILSAAVDMYKEADMLQKKAEETEISFALGYTDSIHDLAYKELMNMQL